MTDPSAAPVHLTVDADVRIVNPARLGAASADRVAEALVGLIRRHAWEAGLEVVDPASVRVVVTPSP